MPQGCFPTLVMMEAALKTTQRPPTPCSGLEIWEQLPFSDFPSASRPAEYFTPKPSLSLGVLCRT